MLFAVHNANAKSIHFEQTKLYSEVSAKAQSENKSFFVYFSASWCGPCQIMNRTAFKDENLVNFIDDKVIPVKADIDQTVGKLWQDEFNVDAVPTIIFFDQWGNETQRVTSGVSGSKLLAILAALNPDHQPADVALPAATFANFQPVEASSNTFISTIGPSDGNYTTFELDLGNYREESDLKFQVEALSDRYEEHRFYIVQRRIPSGKTIYQLILAGFKNEGEANAEAAYLKDKNYDPHLVKM